ncbi:MAG: MnhB domain-containing protein [Deltaproteobacteria bacterium]
MTPSRPSPILTTLAGPCCWFIIALAVVLYLKGHNAPGGGFIAGLLTAAALVLRMIARPGNRRRQQNLALTAVAVGLGLSLATAMGSALMGYPFFSHAFGVVNVPLLGQVELATAAIFDLGIYILVVGNVVTVLSTMTEKQ